MTTSNSSPNSPPTSRPVFTEPVQRVLIMSVPRSGSTLLTDLLNQAGVGRGTKEFFHPSEANRLSITGQSALLQLRKIALVNTHANGRFLCKIHYNQFVAIFKNAERHAEIWLNYFNAFIFTRRRNHLAQAISEYFALKSNNWHTTTDDQIGEKNSYVYQASDLEPLTEILARQMQEEDGWIRTLEQMNRSATTVFYEDLIKSPDETMTRVLSDLNIVPNADWATNLRYKKISDSESVENFKIAYLKDLQGQPF